MALELLELFRSILLLSSKLNKYEYTQDIYKLDTMLWFYKHQIYIRKLFIRPNISKYCILFSINSHDLENHATDVLSSKYRLLCDFFAITPLISLKIRGIYPQVL
jgi:hypothetical protein